MKIEELAAWFNSEEYNDNVVWKPKKSTGFGALLVAENSENGFFVSTPQRRVIDGQYYYPQIMSVYQTINDKVHLSVGVIRKANLSDVGEYIEIGDTTND